MKSLVSLTAGAIAVALVSSADGAMIAGWSITTAFPTGAGNVPTGNTYSVGAADQGDQTAGSELSSYHTLAAATYTSPAGNGSQYAFSSNNWSIGDYYEARVSTANFANISVSWDQARSSTGPAAFELIFSVDGGSSWTNVAAYTVLQSGGGGAPGTWSSSTYNALYTNSQALAGAEGASQLIIRFRATGAASGSSGSNRIDNVIISGDAVPAPGAVALLAVAGLASRRRR
jgi:MYXO-CTERM domain-containing protein